MEHENLSPQSSDRRSHRLTVRVWRKPENRDRSEIRGKVQHVLTGEVHYPRDWAVLGAFVSTQMDACEDDSLYRQSEETFFGLVVLPKERLETLRESILAESKGLGSHAQPDRERR